MSQPEHSRAKSQAWAWYLAATLAATALAVPLPAYGPAQTAIHLAMNASVIGAFVWGIRRYRPDPRAPWLVLLAGYALLLAANTVRYGHDPLARLTDDPVPAGLYLVAYLAMAIGFLLLVRARGASRDLPSLTDATIVVTASAVLWFEFVIAPLLEGPGVTPSERFIAITYPVPDFVFLILLLWLAFAKGPRGAALALLIGGIAAQALADALLGISDPGLVASSGVEQPLWLLSCALVGAAALHPSLPLVGAKSDRPSWLPAGRRVFLLASLSLLVPLSLLRESIRTGSGGGVVFAVAMTGLVLLVFTRIRWLIADIESHARIEVGLRDSEGVFRTLAVELDARVAARTAELTERDRQLHEATTYLENLVASVPVVLFHGRGFDFVVEYVSPSVEQLLGFTPAEVVANPGFWVERLPPEDRERLAVAAREAAEQELPTFALEHRMITKDGRERWMYSVVRYEAGVDGVLRFTGTSFDISDRKATEDELRRAKEEAERANRAKSEFLSSMSHELRTPLNSVLGFAQLLERSALSPDDRDSVAQVLRAGRTLLAMIDSVLELARVESGQLTLSIEPLSVEELISETVDLVRPMAAGRGIRLVTPADVERAPWVLADRRRIKQVILNLLTNAVTYNRDDGSITIAYHVAAGDRLRLSVTDTGPGIPAERQATLFTILDRRIGSDHKSAGLGVGLALSARLIEAMNGSISVESEVGAGSTFSIELPLAAEPAVGSGERSEPATGAPAGATVVYVEDNLANLRLVERILDVRPGTRVLAAMQGRLGRDLARQHHPDLVLLDLHLPDMPGEEVLRLLQDDPVTRDIPVIVLSSALGNGTGQRFLDLGAKAYFAKPIDVAVFLAAVDRILGGGVAHA